MFRILLLNYSRYTYLNIKGMYHNFLFSSYKERISKLGVKINNVRKIIPSRITTMAFHPSCDKTIICAGDKTGNIGVWNVVSEECMMADHVV